MMFEAISDPVLLIKTLNTQNNHDNKQHRPVISETKEVKLLSSTYIRKSS